MSDVMVASALKQGLNPEVILAKDPPVQTDHPKLTYFGFIPAAIEALSSPCNIAVADIDLMFRGDISTVFSYDFDIAVTVRDHRMIYNTGLWFAKPTFKARQFIRRWIELTHKVYNEFTIEVVNRWGGIDQQSLAETIEEMPDVNVLQLPCRIWNAEQTCWKYITDETKVIHIKSGLRPLCLRDVPIPDKHRYLRPIIEEWKSYDNSCKL